MGKVSLNVEHKIVEVQQHSHGADSITFLFDRYTNNKIDLSLLKSKIILDTYNIVISGLNEFLVQEYTSTSVKLTWVFDRSITSEVGEHKFQIVFVDANDEIIAYTGLGKLKINDSLDVETIAFIKHLSLFQQWEDKMESLADSLKMASNNGYLLTGTDLDILKTHEYGGIYSVDETHKNMPDEVTFGILRVTVVDTYVLQELFSNNKYFTRMNAFLSWTSWVEH